MRTTRYSPLVLGLLVLCGASSAPVPAYHVAESIAVADGAWDYARVDPELRRLYVARATAVTVVDLDHADTSREIGTIQRGHAVVPFAGGSRLLVTSGNDSTVRILDPATGKELGAIPVGQKPDAALYDAGSGRAYVMNAKSGTVSVVDPVAMRVTQTIATKPGLEFAALVGTTLYVNNEDAGELEVIDTRAETAGPAIALAGCEGPTGLGFDARHGRLIVACANGKAAVVEVKSRRVTLTDIGLGPDAVIIDETRRLAFIPCGKDGVLDILSLDAPGGVARVGRVTTEIGARTGALDPKTGAIYLPAAKFGPPAAGKTRPAMLAGTAHILVVRPA